MNMIPEQLQTIKHSIYDPLGYSFHLISLDDKKYSGCQFYLNDKKICFRVANITPKKIGQFVAIWKKDENGKNAPFDANDGIEYLIIIIEDQDNSGQFIFPRDVCIEKGIFSNDNKIGKMGIRLYPPWCHPESKQALHSQNWQTLYFLNSKDMNQYTLSHALNLSIY